MENKVLPRELTSVKAGAWELLCRAVSVESLRNEPKPEWLLDAQAYIERMQAPAYAGDGFSPGGEEHERRATVAPSFYIDTHAIEDLAALRFPGISTTIYDQHGNNRTGVYLAPQAAADAFREVLRAQLGRVNRAHGDMVQEPASSAPHRQALERYRAALCTLDATITASGRVEAAPDAAPAAAPDVPLLDVVLLAKLRACLDAPSVHDQVEVSKNTLRAAVKFVAAKLAAETAASATASDPKAALTAFEEQVRRDPVRGLAPDHFLRTLLSNDDTNPEFLDRLVDHDWQVFREAWIASRRVEAASATPTAVAAARMTDRERAVLEFCTTQMNDLSDADWRQHGYRLPTFQRMLRKLRALLSDAAAPTSEVPADSTQAPVLLRELKAARRSIRKIMRTTNEFDEARALCMRADKRATAAIKRAESVVDLRAGG